MRVGSLFVVMLLVGGCNCTRKPAAFVSEAGGFSALFPSVPTEQVKKGLIEESPVELHTFMTRLVSGDVLAVTYNDYPQQLVARTTAVALLDEAREELLAATASTLISETDEQLGPCAGRDLQVNASGGKVRMHLRVFLCGRRMYQASWVGPLDAQSEEKAKAFLASFQVLTADSGAR